MNMNSITLYINFFILDPDTDITYIEKLDNYISGRIPENIFFTIPLMSSQYVLQQLSTLDISKATGLDNTSAKMPYFLY
jgi:hypothetical protein